VSAAADDTLFTLSFDDGVPLDRQVATLLSEYRVRATFYASTGPSGARSIGDDDLHWIGERHELGNHGKTHRLFTGLSASELEAEVSWGQAEMARFGPVAPVVAPPRGRISGSVVAVVRSLGFGIRTAPLLGTGTRRGDILDPSFLFFPHRTSALAREAVRRRRLPMTALLLAWGGGRDYRVRTERLVRAAAQHTSCVHVWGHADEIERLDLWQELENVLALARELGMRPATNGEVFAALGPPPRHAARPR
jgi:peptidoglycan/xylan/chitin deacetylase (PgdA/CDA1 family)